MTDPDEELIRPSELSWAIGQARQGSSSAAEYARDLRRLIRERRETAKWETGQLYASVTVSLPPFAERFSWNVFERVAGGWRNRSNVFIKDGSLDTSGLRKLVFEEEQQ